jgi:hypothetical protein
MERCHQADIECFGSYDEMVVDVEGNEGPVSGYLSRSWQELYCNLTKLSNIKTRN